MGGIADWVGNSGAGHFVKMVHNGIEYGGGLLAYAEGIPVHERWPRYEPRRNAGCIC